MDYSVIGFVTLTLIIHPMTLFILFFLCNIFKLFSSLLTDLQLFKCHIVSQVKNEKV